MEFPFWKLRREGLRVKQQLQAISDFFLEGAKNRQHQHAFEAGFPVQEGDVSLQEKVAILLIYQPKELPKSLLSTCNHLKNKGYSILMVSNAPIGDVGAKLLKPLVWRIIERPNFGYDFGGYRDGILMLKKWNVSPALLMVLNDSVWFPCIEDETLIEKSEAFTSGLTGTILRTRGDLSFLEGYFYVIPRSTFENAAFDDYWSNLKLTSNKYKVIRSGERGFSQAMSKAGLSLNPVYSAEQFIEQLQIADDALLRNTLRFAALTDGREDKITKLAQSNEDDWRASALSVIQSSLSDVQPHSAYPVGMMNLLGFPIIKKSGHRSALQWQESVISAVEHGAIAPLPDAVLAELKSNVAAIHARPRATDL